MTRLWAARTGWWHIRLRSLAKSAYRKVRAGFLVFFLWFVWGRSYVEKNWKKYSCLAVEFMSNEWKKTASHWGSRSHPDEDHSITEYEIRAGWIKATDCCYGCGSFGNKKEVKMTSTGCLYRRQNNHLGEWHGAVSHFGGESCDDMRRWSIQYQVKSRIA